MPASELFKPETVQAFKEIYSEYKEAIDFKVRYGNPTEKAFAKTVLVIAGMGLP